MVVFDRQINLYGLTDDAHRSGDGWLDFKGIESGSGSDNTYSDSIKIGRATGSVNRRGIVQIKLPAFPFDDANGEIVDLKLHLFCHTVQNDWADKINVYRITKNVRMSNVSWDEYSDTSGENLTWTTGGATGADDIDVTTNYGHGANGIIDTIATPAADGWAEFDLSGLVRTGKIKWDMDSSASFVHLLLKSEEGEALHNGEFTGVQHLDSAPLGTYVATTSGATWCIVQGEHTPSDTTILCDDVDGGSNAIVAGDVIAVTDYAPDTTQTWDTVEFMKVTDVNTSTNIITVERGFDGTTARTILDNSLLSRFANASPYLSVTYKNNYPTAPTIEVVPQDNGIDSFIRITNTVADKDLTGFITAWNTTLSSLDSSGSNNTTVTTESANFDSTNATHVAANLLNTANTNYYVSIYSTDNEVDNPTTGHGAVGSNIVTVIRPTISSSALYTNADYGVLLGSDGSTNANVGQELYLKVIAHTKIKKVYVNWDAGVSDTDDDYVEYVLENVSTTSSDGVQISHKYPDTGLHNVKIQVESVDGFRSGTTAARGTAITGHDPNIATSNPVAKISTSRSKVLSSVYPDQTTGLVLSGAHSYAIGSNHKIAEYQFSYDAHRSTSDTDHDTTCTAHANSNDNSAFEESSSSVYIKAADSADVSSQTTFKVYGLKSVTSDGSNVVDTSSDFSHYVWDSATLTVSGTGDTYGSASSEYFKTIETVVGTVSTDGDDDGIRYVLSRATGEDSKVDINEGGTYGSSDVTLTVTDGDVFTAGDEIKIDNEIMLVVSVSGDNLTVHRAYQGTSAATHADGANIEFINHKINKEIRLKDRDGVASTQYGRWSGRAYYKANDGSGCVFTTSNDGIRIANAHSDSTGGTATSWLDHGFYVGDTIKIGGTSNNGTNVAPNTATIIDMLTGSATNDTILVDINLTDETVQASVIRSDHALKPVTVAIYNSASTDKVTFYLEALDDSESLMEGSSGVEDTTRVTVSYPKTLDLDAQLDAGNIAINNVNLSRSGGLSTNMPLGVRRYPVAGVRTSMGNPTLSCEVRTLNDTGFTKIFSLLEGGIYDYVFLDTKKVDSPSTAFKSFKMRLLSGSINKSSELANQYKASLQFAIVGEEEA